MLKTVYTPCQRTGQWRRKLEIFEGDGDEQFGDKEGFHSKTHRFGFICFLPMENLATVLDFFFHFLDFSLLFFFIVGFYLEGTSPSLKILGGDTLFRRLFRFGTVLH